MRRRRTFGQAIREARKSVGLTLKAVAEEIRRGDGRKVLPQCLNDLEFDRCYPPENTVIEQLLNCTEAFTGHPVLLREAGSRRHCAPCRRGTDYIAAYRARPTAVHLQNFIRVTEPSRFVLVRRALFAWLTRILLALRSLTEARASREAEILLLRQQLLVLNRKSVRFRLRNIDRLKLVWLSRLFACVPSS